jgi:hypothetical protein
MAASSLGYGSSYHDSSWPSLMNSVAATHLSTSRFHYWLDYDDDDDDEEEEFIAKWSNLPNHTWFK